VAAVVVSSPVFKAGMVLGPDATNHVSNDVNTIATLNHPSLRVHPAALQTKSNERNKSQLHPSTRDQQH
jgi:hypothetical protein